MRSPLARVSAISPVPSAALVTAAESISRNGRLIVMGSATPKCITTRLLVIEYVVVRATSQANSVSNPIATSANGTGSITQLGLSLDGYGAGPDQDIDNPLGVGAIGLHQWLISTRTFQRTLFGKDGGM